MNRLKRKIEKRTYSDPEWTRKPWRQRNGTSRFRLYFDTFFRRKRGKRRWSVDFRRNRWVLLGQVRPCSGIHRSVSMEHCHRCHCRDFKLLRDRDKDTSQIRTARTPSRRIRTGLTWSRRTVVSMCPGQSPDHPWQWVTAFPICHFSRSANFGFYPMLLLF